MDEEIMSSNFIHDFIDEDLKEGVYDHEIGRAHV